MFLNINWYYNPKCKSQSFTLFWPILPRWDQQLFRWPRPSERASWDSLFSWTTYTMLQRLRRYAWWTRTSSHWPSLTRAPLSRSCTRSAKPSFSPSSTSAHAGALSPDSIPQHTKIRPKDVPGTLLNIALLNLGSSDPSLRWESVHFAWHLGRLRFRPCSGCFQPNNLIVLGEWSNASRCCCSDNEPFICRLLPLFGELIRNANTAPLCL